LPTDFGMQEDLYPETLADSLAVNKYGDLWLTDTKVYRTAADVAESDVTVESEFFVTAEHLHYSNKNIFFTGVDAAGVYGVYMKPVEHGEESSNILI